MWFHILCDKEEKVSLSTVLLRFLLFFISLLDMEIKLLQ